MFIPKEERWHSSHIREMKSQFSWLFIMITYLNSFYDLYQNWFGFQSLSTCKTETWFVYKVRDMLQFTCLLRRSCIWKCFPKFKPLRIISNHCEQTAKTPMFKLTQDVYVISFIKLIFHLKSSLLNGFAHFFLLNFTCIMQGLYLLYSSLKLTPLPSMERSDLN